MIGNSSKCLIIYITPSPNVCLGKPKLLAQPLVMGIHLFDFTPWLTLVHSGSLSAPKRHPLYIAEAPPPGHENPSRQWQIQHTTESKWQIQHTTTITFTKPLDLWLLQENPSTLNTSGWLIVWSQIFSLWPVLIVAFEPVHSNGVLCISNFHLSNFLIHFWIYPNYLFLFHLLWQDMVAILKLLFQNYVVLGTPWLFQECISNLFFHP